MCFLISWYYSLNTAHECPHSLTLLESDGKKKSGLNKYPNLEPDIKQKDEMIVRWSD